ncbi:MAG: HNH endonuclease signature motif containing protein [Pseudomonadota bacterium]
MAKYRFTAAERCGIWLAHDSRCFWCEEPVEFKHVTVDHVIPEHLVDKPEELASVLTEYGLPEEYQVNDFPNWVPAHQSCNRSKGTVVHRASPAMISALHRASRSAEVARRKAAQIAREPDQAKAIAMVETWVRADIVQVTDLAEVVSRHQGVAMRLVAVEAPPRLKVEGLLP